MFRGTVVFSSSEMEMFLDITTLKDEDITLPRNVWIQLPGNAQLYRRRMEFSSFMFHKTQGIP